MNTSSSGPDARIEQVKALTIDVFTDLQCLFPDTGIIYGIPRDPSLKGTKSYSCNILIKLYHSNPTLK